MVNGFQHIFKTGTTQQPPSIRKVQVGRLSALVVDGSMRQIAFGGVELVRQIDFPVRDENWGTYTPTVISETFEEKPDSFQYTRCFEVADAKLSCRVVYEIHNDGTVTAIGEAQAKTDFTTNRTGFTLLHPIAGVKGKPVALTTPDGEVQHLTMPDAISPDQPVKNIGGLAFDIEGLSLNILFVGDVFEMEDQRNWSDASFKTYSRPLLEPFAYVIPAGTTVRQEIILTIAGEVAALNVIKQQSIKIGETLTEPVPEILLAAEADWLGDTDDAKCLASSQFKALLLRTSPLTALSDITQAKALLDEIEGKVDLEIILEDRMPALPQLESVAQVCAQAGIKPRHVTALPKAYLKSYQPNGKWPDGMTPQEAYKAARTAFNGVRIGSGMLTHFTEFNRCRPDGLAADYITHGNASIVHAADDMSVKQTLETLPDIFSSAKNIGGDRGYRLGLMAIGLRSNPYGDAVAENPDQARLPLATWDPRSRALFGAAWAVGVLAATEGYGIEALALGSLTGPFGVLSKAASVERPWFDDHPEAKVYPVYHVLNTLAAGRRRCKVAGLSTGLAAIASETSSGRSLLVANLSDKTQQVALKDYGRAAILDEKSFEFAVNDPLWPSRAMVQSVSQTIILTPLAVLFFETQ